LPIERQIFSSWYGDGDGGGNALTCAGDANEACGVCALFKPAKVVVGAGGF